MPTLNFKGKTFVHNHHLAVKYHQLVPKKEKSYTDKVSLHDNLIVQGDNLKALKALLPAYAGRVKCIYIDPPYNTGNEGWVYNDKVNSPMMREWLGKEVALDDLTRHEKWLCMMMPRLKLLHELLAEDGVIFISIDDNEQHHLRSLLDEIFGERNFIANLPTIMNLKGNNDQFGFAGAHEYTIVFSKNIINVKLNEFRVDEEEVLKKWSSDHIGYYKKGANLKATGTNAPRSKRPNLYYPIFIDENNDIYVTNNNRPNKEDDISLLPITDGEEMSWRWEKKKVNDEPYNIIAIRNNDTYTLYKKQRPILNNLPTKKPKSIFYKPEYSSGNGTTQIKEFFEEKIFNNPKPIELIKDFIKIATNKNDLILDSFAGSGTTAHAVLALNKEDGGNRKFILIEMEDYANEITAERVRRVIKGVPASKNFKEGTGGTFSYFELGGPIEMESILEGDCLPSYKDFAKYLFYTATGEEFDPSQINEKTQYIGTSKAYDIYLFYQPDIDYLKSTRLTLERAKALGPHQGKTRLVFAPAKFIDLHTLTDLRIEFSQLPFEIYKLKS